MHGSKPVCCLLCPPTKCWPTTQQQHHFSYSHFRQASVFLCVAGRQASQHTRLTHHLPASLSLSFLPSHQLEALLPSSLRVNQSLSQRNGDGHTAINHTRKLPCFFVAISYTSMYVHTCTLLGNLTACLFLLCHYWYHTTDTHTRTNFQPQRNS